MTYFQLMAELWQEIFERNSDYWTTFSGKDVVLMRVRTKLSWADPTFDSNFYKICYTRNTLKIKYRF